MNIRNSVPNDHVQSISEIAKSQSSMIQLLTIEIQEKDKEIERLNNIIDELEKNLNILLQTEQAWDEYCYGYNDCLEDMLNKLKELKGSDE